MLTAYQLGHIDSAWEPFFMGSPTDPRNGTEEIITSDVSKAWPIPDAGLGAVSYIFEILMAVMGTRDRRSEEHTSELQSLMRISYAVFCLKKKTKKSIKSTNNEPGKRNNQK